MTFKVFSMNIHKGFSFFNSRFTLHELKVQLVNLNPDLIFLQEVVGENSRHEKSIPAWPKKMQSEFLSEPAWPYHVYGKNATYHQRHHGNAILSRWPIVFSENIPLSTYRLEQRGLLHCQVRPPNSSSTLHLFNAHLDLTHWSRQRQIQKVIDRAQSHVPHESPFIFAGDFNDWQQKLSPILNTKLQLREASKGTHGHYQKSFPSFLPLLTLDRMYVRHLEVSSVMTLRNSPWPSLSDHLPMLVEFRWKETGKA